jgi:putative transposase
MWTAEDRERYKDDSRRYPSDLTDAEWDLVRPLFEIYPTLSKDIREMVNGCLYLAAEGCRWRSLPKEFGPWQTVRGYWDRFQRDEVWADAAALLIPAARARLGRSPEPSTGIVDSQSVVSGPQRGERGVDGNKKVKGIKRHVLTCSFGFILAILVSAANLHDTHGLAPLLERADQAGWDLERIKVDGIYAGPTVRAGATRHGVDVQVSLRDPAARGFAPLPLRWRIEATFGTLTNRYRRLTRNLEQSHDAAENVVQIANLRRVLRVLAWPAQEQTQ